ncbi:hypothetical protein BGZ65_000932 [Modicella reniformis]|uniref:Pentatricopeptide repeat-containing protein n=1 Tax=Modicella reniformis TaxID=1440133 RepID=A0A9P6J2N4_9FUNG|nr:hypothetical protein BGZ65_000932 [Modicella reniformis]
MHSPRGNRGFKREMNVNLQRMTIKHRNSTFSWWRPFVRIHRKLRQALCKSLELKENGARHAIRLTKVLLKAKAKGARLPNGTKLLKLTNLDNKAYYARHQRELSGDTTPSLISLPDQRFLTEDYNSILEHCDNIRDWGYGYAIASVLMNRYQLTGFNLQSSDAGAPNTRTIHLLASIFAKIGRIDKAKHMFAFFHQHYPLPIPIDVYTAYLGLLSGIPGQIQRMESLLKYLETHGPAPTITGYNSVLKAIGFQVSLNRAEAFLGHMSRCGYGPDPRSFRVLMDVSLKRLNMVRAHYWLAEYERQGFEVRAWMLEPFMKTCVQQVIRYQDQFKSVNTVVDSQAESREWMYKALHLLQFMTNRRIEPTATTLELLIEGFLTQGNLPEARKILHIMRGRPHLYTPVQRTWILFFEYHLAKGDYSSALTILNEMRKALRTRASPHAKVPTRLYRQIFQHLLQRGKLPLAEKTLYEMMIRQGKTQPREKAVVDLIWTLERWPESAERVYELLYSQTRRVRMPYTLGPKSIRLNQIMEHGPIQMANVGVMHAKANSKNPALQSEVWKTWLTMVHYFSDQVRNQKPIIEDQDASKMSSVLGIAFEQVARATRKGSEPDKDRLMEQKPYRAEDDWNFQIRRTLGSNSSLSLMSSYGVGGAASTPISNDRIGSDAAMTTKHIQFNGKFQMMIEKLLRRQEFLQPLLNRRNASAVGNGSSNTNMNIESSERLENLKTSFAWVQGHGIPIQIDGFNFYLESLLSHRDFATVKDSVERVLLEDHHHPEGRDGTSSLSLQPDINTIKILNDHKGLLTEGRELIDRVLYKGGPGLIDAWTSHSENIQRHRQQAHARPGEPLTHLNEVPLDRSIIPPDTTVT